MIDYGSGLSEKTLNNAIKLIRKKFDADKIYLKTQYHANDYYKREGLLSNQRDLCKEILLMLKWS
ncbi:hypothetical protein [Falseniella ignava]|mgnify:CR=1 FL=1|uniref:Uncharacterized protein n=1 Tax=Falseniella ignava CCUG 37419 TaxID=883112 RepID=K1LGK0_9LACT|nr:hypothetical protein [Falseniella ignava]EKB53736.1 hypothetical protein HMPREF9707_01489 [Falseniella ignava CCUG 37419]